MTGFLVDTNVISEYRKPKPEPRVQAWLDSTQADALYTSVLTLGEIRRGIVSAPSFARRASLEAWFDEVLLPWFEDRILPVDEAIAHRWGVITGQAEMIGRPLPIIDSLLAATAIEHNLTLTTRDTGQLSVTGVALFNPWEG